jgi:hypothetical protein
MSQDSLEFPTTGTLSGLTLVEDINGAFDAVNTDNSGATAPTNQLSGSPSAGNRWLNTASPSSYLREYFDGTDWLIDGYVDPVNHIWQPIIGGGAGTLAAATTTDLGSVPQSVVSITGTSATITSFGTSAPIGSSKIIKFASAGVVIDASSNIILPGGVNITVQAADYAFCTQMSSGVWLVNYFRASGQPIGFSNAAGVFGDGSDGNLTISSGVTSLTRDMYYNNVTISGSAQINTNGFRLFVAGTLNIANAPAAAIYAGPAGTTVALGVTPMQSTPTSTDWGQTPGAGGNGAVGKAPTTPYMLGGLGGQGGAGDAGLGSGYAGGAQAGSQLNLPRLILASILAQLSPLQPTGGGPGAGGGGVTTSGYYGGAGAYGGLPLLVFAAAINRGSSTATNALQSYGGTGQTGTNIAARGTGGGGGGGGGPVIVIYGALIGSAATNALLSEGGPGGNGGTATTVGYGGQGGGSGPILLGNATSGAFSFAAGNAAGAAPSTITGGSGATTQLNL